MCGILFARRRDKHPVQKALLKRYHKQKHRGSRGFGFIALKDGKVVEVERFELEKDAETAVSESKQSEILFHHRLPTSTPNHKDATHPIAVVNDELDHNYYLVHNGVLRNEKTLRPIHEGLGYEYMTVIQEIKTVKSKKGKKEEITEYFNDSEALAIEVARFLDGKSKKIDAVGSIAFVCFETDKEDNVLKIHYGRNSGNPLVVENNGDLFFLKSEGDGQSVPENVIHTIDYKTGQETTRAEPVGRVTLNEYTGYSGYRGETQKEQGRIGFGSGRDDERTSTPPLLNGARLSPIQNRGGVLDWGEDDLPFGDEIPTIHLDDVDYDGMYAEYQKSEEHLWDLWTELESLKTDIRKCKENLANPSLSTGDTTYNEEYLAECEEVFKAKDAEAKKLEDYLASVGR